MYGVYRLVGIGVVELELKILYFYKYFDFGNVMRYEYGRNFGKIARGNLIFYWGICRSMKSITRDCFDH